MNPEKPAKAVALRYESSRDGAPRVVAKGRGHVAQSILGVARQHHVPVHEDPGLAEVLEALDLDLEIPPELYRAVAEVLAFVYRLNGRLAPR
jgi:flagellar biosynthesis protein